MITCNSKQSTLALYCFYRKRHNLFDVTLTDMFRIIVNTLIIKISIEEKTKGENTDNSQLWTGEVMYETKGDIDVDT